MANKLRRKIEFIDVENDIDGYAKYSLMNEWIFNIDNIVKRILL